MQKPAAFALVVREPVLVTSAGTIVAQGIMKCLRLAGSHRTSHVNYRVVAVDMSPSAVGLYRGDVGIRVPPAASPTYIEGVIKICRDEGVRAVFIGSEEELLPLSRNAARIEKESGALVVADYQTVLTGRDKWKTFKFMKKNNIPCAHSSLPDDGESFVREFGYPVIVKPREGHGSLQLHLARDSRELRRAVSDVKRAGWRPILQEFLSDADHEFTSGVTTDSSGRRVTSSIAMRRTLKGGQTHVAFVDDFPLVRKAAEEVALKAAAKGPVNVQARLSDGIPKAFELNPRFSASTPIRAGAGVNEPDIVFRNWVLKEGLRVDAYKRLVCFRYLNEVYVPMAVYDEMEREGRTEGVASTIRDYF